MILKILLLIVVQIAMACTSPVRFPLLQPLQGTLQQQHLALQEQMLALQQFQALQRFNAVPSPVAMNPPTPLLLLFPNDLQNTEQDERYTKINGNLKERPSQGIEDEDTDSITIEAENSENIDRVVTTNIKRNPFKAVLLVPSNARFSLGGFIESIPFLPFEVNVPDSISWAWNGISSIISGIGQRWPFRPQMTEIQSETGNQSENNMKSIWNEMKRNHVMPIVVMPLAQPIMQMQG